MEAIILSRRDFRESDQIISAYTKERGKVEALARGVKKIVSKQSAHLEPFSFVMLETVPGKDITHLTTAQPLNLFLGIRNDFAKMMSAQMITRMTDSLTEPNEPDTRIFALLKTWLSFVDKTSTFNWLLIDGFLLYLLSILGFSPILDHCVVCRKSYREMVKEELIVGRSTIDHSPVVHSPKSGLYYAGGGLICPGCREAKQAIGEEIDVCGLKDISNLQMILKGDWRSIANLSFEADETNQLHHLVSSYAGYHTERQLPDWTVFARYGIVFT